ncbi:MAG: methionyl-tRNA formyltransferase [Chlamydiae bacterium]|nr:methionyl-tRNA formyltransferase [Chlamydiota bacterium]
MKIVYFGTPKFASDILAFLIQKKIEVVAVVAQPDSVRGKEIIVPEVKEVAKKFNLPVHQPVKASDPSFISLLKEYNADLFVVCSYGQILKQALLDVPRLGCINIHGSILPRYRGAAPIHRVIMNGEKTTGITIMKMTAGLDSGDIISYKEIPIEGLNFDEVESALCNIAKELIFEAIEAYEKENVASTPQDDTKATYATKILPEEREINWNNDAEKIHNLIRAFAPKPGAYCKILLNDEEKKLKILKSKILDKQNMSKEIILQKNSLIVFAQNQALELLEVQLEGKKPMKIQEFINGLKGKIVFL